MTETIAITAQKRERAGKGPARSARRTGQVPGVIYGGKQAPTLISIAKRELVKQLNNASFFGTLFDVSVEGGASERVLPRDIQMDPVSDQPLHVDFLRVSATTTVTVEVPVHFINEEKSPGLDRGGVLNIVRHEIELVCRADHIPHHVEVDLGGTDIGDSIHISAVTLPEGATSAITDRDFTIATIAAPKLKVETEAEGAEGEGEAAAEA